MRIIYYTSGRAKEYCNMALNLYDGCTHGCIYCYGPETLHLTREQYSVPKMKPDAFKKLEMDVAFMYDHANWGPVLMSFSCDPYMPGVESDTQLAMRIFNRYSINYKILTKAGAVVRDDFNLYKGFDEFGTTLTFNNCSDSLLWEPSAALPEVRLKNLEVAHDYKIRTWVSCEPVVYPEQTLSLIEKSAKYVDTYKIGKLNYHPLAEQVNWTKFARDVVALLRKLKKSYYIKKDLAVHLGSLKGIECKAEA